MARQKLADQQATKWDAEFPELGIYLRVRRFQVRDGLGYAQLERRLIDRYRDLDAKGDADRETEMMYFIQNYPLLRFGLAEAKGLVLPLSEEAFWAMPEEVMMVATEKVRGANPQYGGLPFGELKKMIFEQFLNGVEIKPEPTSPVEKSARKGSSRD